MQTIDSTRLEIRHLRLLVAVAERGCLTSAAKVLYLTQSALSHQLHDAESKLGTKLFRRHGKRMILTAAGEGLLQTSRRVLGELKQAEQQAREPMARDSGILRVGIECYICYHWWQEILSVFRDRYPKVDIAIDVDAASRAAEAVLDGSLDVAIVHGRPANATLKSKLWFRDEMALVVQKDHPLAGESHVELCQLEDQDVLVFPPRNKSYLIQNLLAPRGIRVGRIHEVPLTETMVELAAQGVGVALVPTFAVLPYMGRFPIAIKSVTAGGVYRDWQAVFLDEPNRPPYFHEFLNLVSVKSRSQ